MSKIVNTLASADAILATDSDGVANWWRSLCTNLFRCVKSTQRHTSSVFFFRTTTMGEHHSVALVTGTITPCACSLSSWAYNADRCGNGTRRGVLTQIGVVSGCSLMENNSPGIVWRTPWKTFGSSWMRSSAVTCSLGVIVKLLISDDIWSG